METTGSATSSPDTTIAADERLTAIAAIGRLSTVATDENLDVIRKVLAAEPAVAVSLSVAQCKVLKRIASAVGKHVEGLALHQQDAAQQGLGGGVDAVDAESNGTGVHGESEEGGGVHGAGTPTRRDVGSEKDGGEQLQSRRGEEEEDSNQDTDTRQLRPRGPQHRKEQLHDGDVDDSANANQKQSASAAAAAARSRYTKLVRVGGRSRGSLPQKAGKDVDVKEEEDSEGEEAGVDEEDDAEADAGDGDGEDDEVEICDGEDEETEVEDDEDVQSGSDHDDAMEMAEDGERMAEKKDGLVAADTGIMMETDEFVMASEVPEAGNGFGYHDSGDDDGDDSDGSGDQTLKGAESKPANDKGSAGRSCRQVQQDQTKRPRETDDSDADAPYSKRRRATSLSSPKMSSITAVNSDTTTDPASDSDSDSESDSDSDSIIEPTPNLTFTPSSSKSRTRRKKASMLSMLEPTYLTLPDGVAAFITVHGTGGGAARLFMAGEHNQLMAKGVNLPDILDRCTAENASLAFLGFVEYANGLADRRDADDIRRVFSRLSFWTFIRHLHQILNETNNKHAPHHGIQKLGPSMRHQVVLWLMSELPLTERNPAKLTKMCKDVERWATIGRRLQDLCDVVGLGGLIHLAGLLSDAFMRDVYKTTEDQPARVETLAGLERVQFRRRVRDTGAQQLGESIQELMDGWFKRGVSKHNFQLAR